MKVVLVKALVFSYFNYGDIVITNMTKNVALKPQRTQMFVTILLR